MPLQRKGDDRVRRCCASDLFVAVGFIALALVLTWPLGAELNEGLVGGGAGDNVVFFWNFWWMRYALSTAGESFWWSGHIFYPFGVSLVLDTHTALNAFLGAELLSRMSILGALNTAILASVAANGFCAYLLAAETVGDRGAAGVAGVFFAACPYLAAHLQGHFNLVSAWPLPLFALLWRRVLLGGGATDIVAAGVVLGLTSYVDYYYLVYLSIFACVTFVGELDLFDLRRSVARTAWTGLDWWFLLVVCLLVASVCVIHFTGGTVVTVGRLKISATSGLNLMTAAWCVVGVLIWRRWRPSVSVRVRLCPSARWSRLRRSLLVVPVALAGMVPLIVRAIPLIRSGDYVSQRYFWRSAPEGVDLVAPLLANPFHPIWGGLFGRVYAASSINPIESIAWLGLVAPLVLILTRRTWIDDPDAKVWLRLIAVFGIWAMGPYLRVLGFNTGLYLPESLIRYVPFIANARIPGRAMVMVYLGLAVLLAVGIAKAEWGSRRALLILLGTFVVLDFTPAPLPIWRPPASPVYESLAIQPAGGVIDFPLGIRDGFGGSGLLDHETIYYQSVHEHPTVGGFVARLPASVGREFQDTPALRLLLSLSAGNQPDVAPADEPSLVEAFTRENGIRYLVLNKRLASPELVALAQSLKATQIAKDDIRVLYRLD